MNRRELAYNHWASQSTKSRSLRKTANETGIPYSTVKYWSAHDNWVKRLSKDTAPAMRSVVQKVQENIKADIEGVVADVSKMRQINMLLLDSFLERLENGEIEVNSIQEYTQLSKAITQLANTIITVASSELGTIQAESENMVSLAKIMEAWKR